MTPWLSNRIGGECALLQLLIGGSKAQAQNSHSASTRYAKFNQGRVRSGIQLKPTCVLLSELLAAAV